VVGGKSSDTSWSRVDSGSAYRVTPLTPVPNQIVNNTRTQTYVLATQVVQRNHFTYKKVLFVVVVVLVIIQNIMKRKIWKPWSSTTVKSLYKQISNLLPFHFVWALQLQMRHPS
jgi:hypothetical protein